jgi:hypothetical protein
MWLEKNNNAKPFQAAPVVGQPENIQQKNFTNDKQQKGRRYDNSKNITQTTEIPEGKQTRTLSVVLKSHKHTTNQKFLEMEIFEWLYIVVL